MTVLNARERKEHDRIWSDVRSDDDMFDAALAENALFDAADRRREMLGAEAVIDQASDALSRLRRSQLAKAVVEMRAEIAAMVTRAKADLAYELDNLAVIRDCIMAGDTSEDVAISIEMVSDFMAEAGEPLVAERLSEVVKLMTVAPASEMSS